MEKRKTTTLEMRAFLKLYFISLSLDAAREMLKSQSVISRIRNTSKILQDRERSDLINYLANYLRKIQLYEMPAFDKKYSEAVLLGTSVNGFSSFFLASIDIEDNTPALFDNLFDTVAHNENLGLLFYILSEKSYSFDAGEAGWSINRDGRLRLQMDFRNEKSACYGDDLPFLESSLRDFFGWTGQSLSVWPSEEELKEIDLKKALQKIERDALKLE